MPESAECGIIIQMIVFASDIIMIILIIVIILVHITCCLLYEFVLSLFISAASLGVYYFLSLTLSVCLSPTNVCLSRTDFKLILFVSRWN